MFLQLGKENEISTSLSVTYLILEIQSTLYLRKQEPKDNRNTS